MGGQGGQFVHRFSSLKITGRNFEYPEALRLIQNEDYLDDADIDELRRNDIVRRISEFNPDVNIRQKRHDMKRTVKLSRKCLSHYTFYVL